MLQGVDLADGLPMFITIAGREIVVMDAVAFRAMQDAALSARPDSDMVEVLRVAEGALKHAPYRNTRTLQALERVSAAIAAITGGDETRREGLRAMVAMDEELEREHPGWMTGEST